MLPASVPGAENVRKFDFFSPWYYTFYIVIWSREKPMPRITSKGQITIPQEIRNQFSLLPGTEVDVIAENNEVLIVKSRKRNAFLKWVGRESSTKGDIDMTVDRLRGRTDE
jgi:AbrB family looped-hinge helix DNA binding protein